MVGPDIQLITPESAADWQDARLVLRDYAASLNVDLGFQGFDARTRQPAQCSTRRLAG